MSEETEKPPEGVTLADVQMHLRRGNAAKKDDLRIMLRWLWGKYLELGETNNKLTTEVAQHQAALEKAEKEKEKFHQIADAYSKKYIDATRQRDLAVMVNVELHDIVKKGPRDANGAIEAAAHAKDLLDKSRIAMKVIDEVSSPYDALVGALDFYADPETYFAIGFMPDKPCGPFIEDFSETDLGQKPGKRARETMALLMKAIEDRVDTMIENAAFEKARRTVEVPDEDEMETCHACGKTIKFEEEVWIDPKSTLATTGEYGKPFHPGCAPEEKECICTGCEKPIEKAEHLAYVDDKPFHESCVLTANLGVK